MVSLDQQRTAVQLVRQKFAVSEGRVGRVLEIARSTPRYRRRQRADESPLIREIQRLARRHPRFWLSRIHALLIRGGWSTNLKRVHRLWKEIGLKRPIRLKKAQKTGRKPSVAGNSCQAQPARFKNDVWTCEFIHDRTAEGRPLKWLHLVDEYTRECLVLHVDRQRGGADVRRVLGRVVGRRGAPQQIRSDNGSEFICEALSSWLPGVGTKAIPVASGSPWQNGYMESFHSRLRDEFLERHEFESVADARSKASWVRREYNHVRLHSSLKYSTPHEFRGDVRQDERGAIGEDSVMSQSDH